MHFRYLSEGDCRQTATNIDQAYNVCILQKRNREQTIHTQMSNISDSGTSHVQCRERVCEHQTGQRASFISSRFARNEDVDIGRYAASPILVR